MLETCLTAVAVLIELALVEGSSGAWNAPAP